MTNASNNNDWNVLYQMHKFNKWILCIVTRVSFPASHVLLVLSLVEVYRCFIVDQTIRSQHEEGFTQCFVE